MSQESGQANQPQLFMRQPDLSGLPTALPLEPGSVLRKAVPADHEQLAGLLSEAFGDSWDARRVAEEFSPGNGVEATYVVAVPAGVVATAAARRLPGRYPDAGYVHYVGARSSQRGKRLGEVVTRRVLAHFAAEGLDQAVLETDDFRVPAIWTYLRLGFVPEPRVPGDVVRWSAVLRNLTAGPQRGSAAEDASAAYSSPAAQPARAPGARS
jgi:mycothiol synthase